LTEIVHVLLLTLGKTCALSVNSPSFFVILGLIILYFTMAWRVWGAERLALLHSKDILYSTGFEESISYLSQFLIIFHGLGVYCTPLYFNIEGLCRLEVCLPAFQRYFILNIPGGHFISQLIPHCFLWYCSHLHSILLSFEDYIKTRGLHFSVSKISYVKLVCRAFSISFNSLLFLMILWFF